MPRRVDKHTVGVGVGGAILNLVHVPPGWGRGCCYGLMPIMLVQYCRSPGIYCVVS